ncbi:MAG: hypothetical protein JO336_14185 [Acidobacteriia bacterium]|nr:hypothetical protein [Terriglobia bacterium]MBV8906062.1 hypothetical protein [Terriglobia bacterium]MBV9745339.1 hypothetical protein [Terriglobia bacterium]
MCNIQTDSGMGSLVLLNGATIQGGPDRDLPSAEQLSARRQHSNGTFTTTLGGGGTVSLVNSAHNGATLIYGDGDGGVINANQSGYKLYAGWVLPPQIQG